MCIDSAMFEDVIEDVPCVVLQLSLVICWIEEVKLQLYFAYSLLPFPSKISDGFCVSFIYKPVSLSLHSLVKHDVTCAFIWYLHAVCYFLLYIHPLRIYSGIYRADVLPHTWKYLSVSFIQKKMPKPHFFLHWLNAKHSYSLVATS